MEFRFRAKSGNKTFDEPSYSFPSVSNQPPSPARCAQAHASAASLNCHIVCIGENRWPKSCCRKTFKAATAAGSSFTVEPQIFPFRSLGCCNKLQCPRQACCLHRMQRVRALHQKTRKIRRCVGERSRLACSQPSICSVTAATAPLQL